MALLAQVDTQERVYRAAPLASSGTPVWGVLGLRWAPRAAWLLEADISEDLQVGSAPDVTFMLGVTHLF